MKTDNKARIVLNAPTSDQHEFVKDYRNAVLETLLLLFERRELDLGEQQLYALHQLTHSALVIEVQE